MSRSTGTVASTTLVATIVIGSFSTAPLARAEGHAINGTYIATSVGEWAKTNEVFHDEGTVRSTWTITSSCETAQDCSGQVTSDQGWSARISSHDETPMWYVRRDVPNWEFCPDGTAVTGHQTFTFTPVGPDGMIQQGSPTLAGLDKTVGPSGACGINRWLVIQMPFRLDKIA
ncbi:Rv2253/PknI dimerization domain-containing protein [Mycobacterium noviomagense]|nr:hypothetical protein BST37_10180 [Mycobacterium noviomagense]